MFKVHSHPVFLSPHALHPERPLFVFLPGMDGTGKLLQTQTAGLEPHFNIRCLAIPPDDLTDWDQLSERVVALTMAELARMAQPSVYLCGESFGGCLALKVALKAPQLFDRIILVNPASSFGRRPWIYWGSLLVQGLPQFLYQASAVTLLPFLAALERIAPADRQALLAAMRSVPQTTSVWRLNLLSQFQVEVGQLWQLRQPVLLVASRADRLLPSLSEAQRLLGLLPHAQVVVLPHSGHACLLEAEVNLYQILAASNFLGTTAKVAAEAI